MKTDTRNKLLTGLIVGIVAIIGIGIPVALFYFFVLPYFTVRNAVKIGMTKTQVISNLGYFERVYFIDPKTHDVYYRLTKTNEVKKAPLDKKTGKPNIGVESYAAAIRGVDYEMFAFTGYIEDACIYVYFDNVGRVVHYEIAGS